MYATLTELKSLLGISHDNQNVALEIALDAAQAMIDKHCQRTFTLGTSETRLYRPSGTRLVLIDDLVTLSSLKTGTGGSFTTTWSASDYQLEPYAHATPTRPYDAIRAVTTNYFPFAYEEYTVSVTGTFGWASVPAPIKQGTLILASRFYKRKDTIEGAIGFADAGAALRISFMDPDVAAIVSRYRKVTL